MSAGYARHSYGSDRFTFRGLRLGFQAPLRKALRLSLRVYQMEPRNAEVDRGTAADLGIALGLRGGRSAR